MSEEFIAELHDIGKLVDKKQLKKYQFGGHTFEDFNFSMHQIREPSSPSWWAQYHHIKKITETDINDWRDIDGPYKPDVFLLVIADHLASSISRVLPPLEKAGETEGVLKLWNKNFYENEKNKGKYWAAFKSDGEFEQIFKIIDEVDSPDEFLEKYRENLLLTPEDKGVPRNITSLYTHIELVGKIYRVLKKHCIIRKDGNGIALELNGKLVKKIREAEGGGRTTGNQNVEKGKWQARFIKCRVKFSHSFVRLQDINLLVKRNELINCFAAKYNDYVMFSTPNFISLFLPLGIDLKEMFKLFLDNGFFIECVETIADLGILSSNLDIKTLKARTMNKHDTIAVLTSRNTKVYKHVLVAETMPEEIQPPICDICQMQNAQERVKENIREWICDKCYETRESGQSFNYPEEWEDSKVVWFKFSLNLDKLENWLQNAFEKHVNGTLDIKDRQTVKEEFRSLACHADFVKDYTEMVKKFWQRCKDIEIVKPISDYDELGVGKYSGKLVQKIIKEFIEMHNEYFPDCSDDNRSPISLSLSISHIKYPVREHWRYFEDPAGFLNIKSQNIFEETYTKGEIDWLLNRLSVGAKASLGFIYKLVGLYDELKSDINIKVEILNNKDRHPEIYRFYSKFETSPAKILNFFKIIEAKDEVSEA